MFATVLVANRGEIAVRIIRTLHRLGIRSVAIFSEADSRALHVAMADKAVLIGPADARSSYLSLEKVMAAAIDSGAQAIHPGYGFLAENADFAKACESVGIVFIGPSEDSIRLMGDKRAAKDAVAALGIPVVPGFHGQGISDADLALRVAEIGFPVMIKPAAGGGGKGMHVVRDPSDVAPALESARRESLASFGDDALLLERYVPAARHVEVQVVGDGLGAVVHLGDRDCSLQRRHQKIIEEAPAPFLPDESRDRMRADAVAIAVASQYRGVGTVEFVVDATDPTQYFFLEMNTRLQVEHPVTEMVTGLDLVELQLQIASGQGLSLTQADVLIFGHAVEARVYAEDGHHGFLPSVGTILTYQIPAGTRVDSGVTTGSVIGTSYDPLMFKVIVGGADRAAALLGLDDALAQTTVLGVAHNVGALRELLRDSRVTEGSMVTDLIESMGLGEATPILDDHTLIAAALGSRLAVHRPESPSTWDAVGAWRIGGLAPVVTRLVDEDGRARSVSAVGSLGDCIAQVGDGEPASAAITWSPDRVGDVLVTVAGTTRRYAVALEQVRGEDAIWIGRDGDAWSLRLPPRSSRVAGSDSNDVGGELHSPMPGTVVIVSRSVGDPVRSGDLVLVVEAMKMEYPLKAPFDGVLASLSVDVGAQVFRDQVVAVVHVEKSK
jgi:acetyl-CoA/propionyl-CoA carboxylase biotin carboxyl carrier protein